MIAAIGVEGEWWGMVCGCGSVVRFGPWLWSLLDYYKMYYVSPNIPRGLAIRILKATGGEVGNGVWGDGDIVMGSKVEW